MQSVLISNTVKDTHSHRTPNISSNQYIRILPIVLCVISAAFLVFTFAYIATYCNAADTAFTNLAHALTLKTSGLACTVSQVATTSFSFPTICCAFIGAPTLALSLLYCINKETSYLPLMILLWLTLTAVFSLSITTAVMWYCPTMLSTTLVMCVTCIALASAALASALSIERYPTSQHDNDFKHIDISIETP